MFPELRAQRLLEIAARVQDEFGGDLRAGLTGPLSSIRKAFKKFPSIADPAVDRILLFGGISPVPALPSNCPHVLVRIGRGQEGKNYGATYREAQELIEDAIPATFDARQRAFLIVKWHGQNLCKGSNPKCDQCPVHSKCAFFAQKGRWRSSPVAK
jgi:adenine-specific DNA glycosylase